MALPPGISPGALYIRPVAITKSKSCVFGRSVIWLSQCNSATDRRTDSRTHDLLFS
jgi:hypothetical protein